MYIINLMINQKSGLIFYVMFCFNKIFNFFCTITVDKILRMTNSVCKKIEKKIMHYFGKENSSIERVMVVLRLKMTYHIRVSV